MQSLGDVFSVLHGCKLVDLLKSTNETALIGESVVQSDISDEFVGLKQFLSCLMNASPSQMLGESHAGTLLEVSGEVLGRKIKPGGDVRLRQWFAIMSVDIAQDAHHLRHRHLCHQRRILWRH